MTQTSSQSSASLHSCLRSHSYFWHAVHTPTRPSVNPWGKKQQQRTTQLRGTSRLSMYHVGSVPLHGNRSGTSLVSRARQQYYYLFRTRVRSVPNVPWSCPNARMPQCGVRQRTITVNSSTATVDLLFPARCTSEVRHSLSYPPRLAFLLSNCFQCIRELLALIVFLFVVVMATTLNQRNFVIFTSQTNHLLVGNVHVFYGHPSGPLYFAGIAQVPQHVVYS